MQIDGLFTSLPSTISVIAQPYVDSAQAYSESAQISARNTFATSALAQAAITAGTISVDGLCYVFSTNTDYTFNIFQNVGGVATDTGRVWYSAVGIDSSLNVFRGIPTLKYQPIPFNSGGLCIMEADSLSEGAYGTTWRTHFQKIMRAAFGDGGPGYQAFDYSYSVDQGANYQNSGWSTISIADGIYGQYAPGGYGQYCQSGTGAEFFRYGPLNKWTETRILYWIQPEGGVFTITGSGGAFSTIIVDTSKTAYNGSTPATSIFIGHVDISVLVTSQIDLVVYTTADGKPTCVFGGLFKNSSYPRGYLQGSLALGGRKFADVAAQDMSIRQQWLSLLAPAAYMLNGGMNDRVIGTGQTPAQHQAAIEAIITANQAAVPTMANMIIQSNESSDWATTNLPNFYPIKKAVALAKGCAFVDVRNALGDYAYANAAGWMADGVHPNATGNAKLAQFYAESWGVPCSLPDPGPVAFAGGGGTPVYDNAGDVPLSIVAGLSGVSAAAIAAGGSGYAVNDTISLGNGVVLTVTTVSSGVITAVSVTSAGSVSSSSLPTNPVSQSSTPGAGTGATFTLTWGVHLATPALNIGLGKVGLGVLFDLTVTTSTTGFSAAVQYSLKFIARNDSTLNNVAAVYNPILSSLYSVTNGSIATQPAIAVTVTIVSGKAIVSLTANNVTVTIGGAVVQQLFTVAGTYKVVWGTAQANGQSVYFN
ncbi:SGNH/GDSL hydrolase family protein [Sodalis ligni]|uniref:SGNH/GDSL hydrolase family protein n=1 Tax=Sodalis ligni TaxID=2697027 RepID=UPI001BDEAC39|nr:SGNH/GDSL hydrolase family protein [Sodalis ligni]QWA09508.1 SGNH/GDSL hydrolase family protein [Sodalis ligni]